MDLLLLIIDARELSPTRVKAILQTYQLSVEFDGSKKSHTIRGSLGEMEERSKRNAELIH